MLVRHVRTLQITIQKKTWPHWFSLRFLNAQAWAGRSLCPDPDIYSLHCSSVFHSLFFLFSPLSVPVPIYMKSLESYPYLLPKSCTVLSHIWNNEQTNHAYIHIWYGTVKHKVKKKNYNKSMGLLERKMCHSGARFQTEGLPELCKDLVYTFCFLLGFSRLTYLKFKKNIA